MDLKSGSFTLIPARTRKGGESSLTVRGCRRSVVDGARCLGAWVSGTGEDRTERVFLMSAWSRAFWANARVLTNRRAPIKSRIRFWKSLLYGISDHRLVSIRPVKSNVAALETASNKLLRFIVGARPRADETRESFCIRRNHLISLSKQESRLSVTERLCWKRVTWVEHIWRDKHSRLVHLLQVHDELFLQTVRALVGNLSGSRSIYAGAMQTPASPGMPVWWAAGWLSANGKNLGQPAWNCTHI